MKYLLVLLLSGCSLFTPSVPSVVERMVEMAADQAMNEAGKALSEVPISCEFEYDRLTKMMHMLCEADLND
ncbi:MAG: hypothetical protein JRD89_20755 [Deltaproteobacteria bacterium]|nr:hypothetical protein [Deltaproteobacteria bacterium]